MALKTTTKTVVKEETVTDTEIITCDVCGRQSPLERPLGLSQNRPGWGEGTVDGEFYREVYTSVTMTAQYNHKFDGGGYGKTWTWHVCPACFQKKMAVWIWGENREARPTTEEWDW